MSGANNRPAGSDNVRQFTVGHDDDGVRLDRWFKRHLPQIGFATISRWARTGQIRVDGKRAAPEDRLATGQTLRVPPGENLIPGAGSGVRARKPLTEAQIEQAHAMVIHRDPAAIVLNKTPGLATQGGSGTFEHVDLLLDAFEGGPRPRLVHRLDKDTSGVLLVAATPGSAAYFAKRFAGRSAKKVYWALVTGIPHPSQGLIDLPLAKQPGSGGEKMMVDKTEHGAPSRTLYRTIDRAGNSAVWVELQPLTGRTHQLRVHMAAIGHPIVGDGKYGGPEAFLTGSISRKLHLHARRLVIDHPDGTPLDVTAKLPDHFAASLAQLGFEEHDGDVMAEDLTTPAPAPTREDEKAHARAHAKQYRKERRGERRKRGPGDEPVKRGATDEPRKRAASPTARPARPGKPAARGPSADAPRSTGPRPPRPGGASGPADARPPRREGPAPARTGKPSAGKPAFPRSGGPSRPGGPPARRPRG